MRQLLSLTNGVEFLLAALFFSAAAIRNCRAGFIRAGLFSTLITLTIAAVYVLLHNKVYFIYSIPAATLVLIFVSLVPLKGYTGECKKKEKRVDERNIPFARIGLKPGSENYESYYSENPEKEEIDSRTRALPGFLSRGSRYYHSLNSPAADAGFFLLEHLKESVDGNVSSIKSSLKPERIAMYLKAMLKTRKFSCLGTAALKPCHYYSHTGRGSGEYGAAVPFEHSSALVIGSEMGSRFTGTAPLSPEVMETSGRYIDCAVAAIQTASFLRNLGFSARAHIDGNYKVVASLLARDSGLGNFGWSGLLLSGNLGPRVRFSVVTTDFEFPSHRRQKSVDYLPFCLQCQKCVRNCPCGAIDRNRPFSVDSDRCFMYWNAVGTDCGKCMSVCPMGHPWGILKKIALRSSFAAWLLTGFDNLFYGKLPESIGMPSWMGVE